MGIRAEGKDFLVLNLVRTPKDFTRKQQFPIQLSKDEGEGHTISNFFGTDKCGVYKGEIRQLCYT